MMHGIQRQALFTIKMVTFLTLGLGLVSWYGLNQTSETITDFQVNNLPEISTALNLSEGVAYLTALAPYVSRSAKPFQLQSERKNLEKRFFELKKTADNLKDSILKNDLTLRLYKFNLTLTELFEKIEAELFLHEDLIAARFNIDEIKRRNPDNQLNVNKIEYDLFSVLDLFIDQENIIQESEFYILENLLSLQLAKQVNTFVLKSHNTIDQQGKQVQSRVQNASILMVIMAGFRIFGMCHHYRFNYKMTQDLSRVTRNMRQLADGDTNIVRAKMDREDEIGELSRAYNIFRDHTLKKQRYSDDLARQKTLLETVFNQINDGLSVFSSDDKLISWNKRYLDIFSLSKEDVYLNRSLNELNELTSKEPHEHRSISNEPIDIRKMNRRRHNRPQNFERHYLNGKIVEFRSQPMPNGGFVTLYSDLTQRRLVESQLHQAQKIEMLGQLTVGAAHDFNNLLAALLTNLQLLSETTGLNEKQTNYMDRSLNITKKGVNLVQRLLAFSRRQHLFPESTNVNDLIIAMLDLVEYSMAPGINITTELKSNDSVYVDPSQLENALLNLAVNSSDAMPGGGHLTFITEKQTMPGSQKECMAVVVKDTGCGIPLEIQKRVREPFFTTKPVGQGSGMGLSMVCGLVKQSGGEIKIHSILNKGTKIILYLPILE